MKKIILFSALALLSQPNISRADTGNAVFFGTVGAAVGCGVGALIGGVGASAFNQTSKGMSIGCPVGAAIVGVGATIAGAQAAEAPSQEQLDMMNQGEPATE